MTALFSMENPGAVARRAHLGQLVSRMIPAPASYFPSSLVRRAFLCLPRGLLGAALVGVAGCLSSLSAAPEKAAPRELKLPALPAKFTHPGLLHSKEELAFVRSKIEAGEEPWKSAFEQMKTSPWADRNYQPKKGRVTIRSGFSGAGAAEGGVADASKDAKTAYTQALMWNLTGDEQYARNAVKILNNWSVLRENRGGNWYLQGAWLSTMMVNAAELVRHTWTGWKPEEIARFSEMLNEAFLPMFHNRPAYGNRLFSVSNAMMAIGVFNEDRAAFTEGMHRWVSYVPCWIYLTSDGPEPIRPDYLQTTPSNDALAALNANLFPDRAKSWIFREQEVLATMKENKLGDDISLFRDPRAPEIAARHWNNAPAGAYVDGLSAETFRDLGHCDLGAAGIFNSAEIAWQQGIDLYGLEQKRLVAFLELNSSLRIDETIPPAFFRVKGTPASTMDLPYNHYHGRKGIALPKTRAYLEKAIYPCLKKDIKGAPGWSWVPVEPGVRAENVVWPITSNAAWDTLTHVGTGDLK